MRFSSDVSSVRTWDAISASVGTSGELVSAVVVSVNVTRAKVPDGASLVEVATSFRSRCII